MCHSRSFFCIQIFFVSVMLSFLNPTSVQAQQRIMAQEGVEVHALLSSKRLNHIAVQNDRIVSVKGLQGEFELEKDNDLGHIFIKPSLKDTQAPIHLFLSTESGKTYTLTLACQDIGAQSIVLRTAELKSLEKESSYEASLKMLIKAMHNQIELEGFLIENLNIKLPAIEGAKLVVLQMYTGQHFNGEILEIHNTTKNNLLLEELDFYKDTVRAITILQKNLPPNAKTRVYRVI